MPQLAELKMSWLKKNELGHNLIVHSSVWGGFLVILNMQITEFAQISMNNGDKQTDESPSWRSPPPCPLFVHSRLCLQLHLNGDYKQACVFRLMCSHPEMNKDHVLTSACVRIFKTVTRNAVNKSVWRKNDCFWIPFNKHATNVSLLFSFRSLPVTFDLVDRSVSCQYGTHAPI